MQTKVLFHLSPILFSPAMEFNVKISLDITIFKTYKTQFYLFNSDIQKTIY